MDADERASFAERLAELRDQAGLSLAGVAAAAHIARGYVHHIEHGRRWPTRPVAKALDDALDAGGALLAAWEVADALPRAAAVPADPQDRERVVLAARHPRRVDVATVSALADVLAATRRLEDQIGSAAVLPGIRSNRALALSLLADARPPIRDRVGLLAGELHQYLGWLLAETGNTKQARAELDAALALGLEIDDPELTSLALSFKGHLAWMVDDPQGVITLSRAASRDKQVFVAQHAYNAYQEARGWAMRACFPTGRSINCFTRTTMESSSYPNRPRRRHKNRPDLPGQPGQPMSSSRCSRPASTSPDRACSWTTTTLS